MVVSPKSQIPIFVVQGEGHRNVLDLFLSVAFEFYFKNLNHQQTIIFRSEDERKLETINNSLQYTLTTPEIKAAKSQNLKYPGKLLCV